ncbi:RcnB family protein [Acinetobacter sp. ANC 4282]|uniref:RcnB family protein n=1 Tax=Acinetobacter terrae TaxID=2731247 RepID=UPI00148FC38C|nr:RcnB family protein [Acinetobacter terrae]NNH16553.1 RcnB family protein [Acinetobacter terrae]
MNTLVKAIVLSLSTALVAAPVMAAPQDHHSQQHNQQHSQQSAQSHHKAPVQQHHNAAHKKAVNPSHDWRVGQKVPSQYYAQSYKVDHKKIKKLSKPGRNQQWIKVNGDYVLINVMSHSIIKIIGG